MTREEIILILNRKNINIEILLSTEYQIRRVLEYKQTYLDKNNITGEDLFINDAMIDYVLTKLNECNYDILKLNSGDLTRVKNYLNVLYEYTLKNPNIIASNKIFKIGNDNLIKIYGLQKINNIYLLYNENCNTVTNIFSRFIKGYNITKEEYFSLIDFLTNNIGTTDFSIQKAQYMVLQKVMLRNFDNSLRTKNFILCYLFDKKMKEEKLDANIYLCDTFFGFIDDKIIGEYSSGIVLLNTSYFRESLINAAIPRRKSEKPLLMMEIIKTLYHEIFHRKQENELKNNNLNEITLPFLEVLLINEYVDEDDYYRNYFQQIFEIDANTYGIHQTIELYREYFYELFKQYEVELYNMETSNENRSKYSIKISGDNKYYLNEKFIVENLNVIVKQNPELLKIYPGLSIIYNNNGNLKNIIELIDQVPCNRSFNKYIIYQINDLENLDIYTLSKEQVQRLLQFLKTIFIESYESLKHIKNIKKGIIKENNFEITKRKLLVALKVYKFLGNNILKLKSKLPENELKEYYENINISIEECNYIVNSFEDLPGHENFGFDYFDIDNILKNDDNVKL